MKGIYRYSIIRFRPYAETGEFANIGVIVFDIASGEADFRVARKRFARIGNFFDSLAHDAYSHAIEGLRIELPRMIEYVPETFSRSAIEQFSDLFGSRESSILFSEPRVIKSGLPLGQLTDDLFDRFVRRDFDKSVDPEAALTKKIRRELHNIGAKHFKSLTLDDEIVPIRFPLGHHGRQTVGIKPLAFNHKSPLHILDYGAYWTKRLSYHINNHNLTEDSVFIPIQGPSNSEDHQFFDAFRLARDELSSLPFETAIMNSDMADFPTGLRHFVERHPPSQVRMWH